MNTPHSCTLPRHDFSERMLWIANLNRDALRSIERKDRSLRLVYAPEAMDRVLLLAEKESACCGFLTFKPTVGPSEVILDITAPAVAAKAAQPLFEQFASKVATGHGCGCNPMVEKAAPASGGPARLAVKTSAVAAVACGVCCLVPFIFPAFALTTAGAGVAAAAGTYWWAIRLSFLLITAGWVWLIVDAVRRGRRPGRSSVIAMTTATGFAVLAYSWSFLEPHIVGWLKQS